jgi:SET domain-containing protein
MRINKNRNIKELKNVLKNNEDSNIDRETLRSNRDIKKGEEILLKYGKYDKFKRNKTI